MNTLEWFLSVFPGKYLPWLMLILTQRFFSVTTLKHHALPPTGIVVLSTQVDGSKCVLLFSFSGANQRLITLNPIDLLPPFSQSRLMSDITQGTLSCTERNGFMHYSRHVNTCTFIWSFQRAQKETPRRHTIRQRQELGQENYIRWKWRKIDQSVQKWSRWKGSKNLRKQDQ